MPARRFPEAWETALPKIRAVTRTSQNVGRGCAYCLGTCLTDLAAHWDAAGRWRAQMRTCCSKEAGDRELLWIFGRSPTSDLMPLRDAGADLRPVCDEAARTEYTSSEPEESTSDSEDASAEARKRRRLRPARTDAPEDAPPPAECTSPEEFASEATTSPDESSAGVVSEASSEARRRPDGALPAAPRRHYPKRACTKRPSVNLQGVLSNDSLMVCTAAAYLVLGVGNKRVRRIKDGMPDRRRRGNRVPNSHPMFQPAQDICRRFLWQLYHYSAEGLPDRFEFDLKDRYSKSLSIGDRAVPLAARTPPEAVTDPDPEPGEVAEEDSGVEKWGRQR